MILSAKDVQAKLPIDTKLLVGLADGSGQNPHEFKIDNYTDSTILISMPLSEDKKPLAVSRGSVLTISAILPSGKLNFDAEVLSGAEAEVQSVQVTIPKDFDYEQMRQYFRVKVMMPIFVFVGSIPTLEMLKKQMRMIPWQKAFMNDISGGGCSFAFEGNVDIGDFVVIDFSYTPMKGGLVECKVVRISKWQNNKRILHLKFTVLNETDRDNIVKIVNQKQMEMRRKSG